MVLVSTSVPEMKATPMTMAIALVSSLSLWANRPRMVVLNMMRSPRLSS